MMLNQWNMERPNLLISVTGAAKDFSMKSRMRAVFRDGLVKAAESTSMLLTLREIKEFILFIHRDYKLSYLHLVYILHSYRPILLNKISLLSLIIITRLQVLTKVIWEECIAVTMGCPTLPPKLPLPFDDNHLYLIHPSFN